jgi:hypothetical protein
MIKGGTGGANTNKTGLKFERDTSLEESLRENGFHVEDDRIFFNHHEKGLLLGKGRLYRYLEGKDVDWKSILSAKLLPDDAVLATQTNRLTIVEKKWQEVSGSVDEKLQTCGFKLRQYKRLAKPLGIEVQYVYLLNDWFAHPRYQDVLNYIQEVGADFHFKSLPLELLGLD